MDHICDVSCHEAKQWAEMLGVSLTSGTYLVGLSLPSSCFLLICAGIY